jgi:hypothetical protein
MKSSALKRTTQPDTNAKNFSVDQVEVGKKIEPHSIHQAHSSNGHSDPWLRMFTEEEVSELLQVSLSQLRKWRMKKNWGNAQGPPFRKIGRLVRYPGHALRAYINGQPVSFQE